MGYVYSDSEMMMATQIAYLDFDNSQNRSVGDVVNEIIMKYGMLDSSGNPVYGDDGNIILKDTYANAGNSKVLTKQLQVVSNIKKLGDGTNGLSGWEDWKVVNVCNDQINTGYYGMLIDTGDGNAIIGCRGSESYNLQQIINDWVVADVGLLNNDLTTQQARSEKYMEELWYQYGDKYDSFSVTGHSLGGNLAEHMTITAPAAMRSRIDHAISFDGPGFSKEYIDAHREDIAKASDRISRYQWSWVASLLLPLPGVKDTIIKAHDDENVFVSFTDSHMNPGGELLSVIMSRIKAMFFRHDTHNVEFDENGSVMAGDESALAAVLGPVSIYIELFDDFIESFEGLQLYGPDDIMQIPLDIMFCGIGLIIRAAEKMYEAGRELGAKITELYYHYIAAQVSGEIEIDLDRVSQYAQELDGKIKLLQDMRDEIDDIRRDLRYWSASGAYYRSRLMIARNGIDIDISHMQKLQKHLLKCVSSYDAVDRKVEASFM